MSSRPLIFIPAVSQRWTVGIIVLLLSLSVATVWLVKAQHRQTAVIHRQGEQITAMGDFSQKMEQAVARLADVEAQSRQPGSTLSPEELRATACGVLRSELGLPAGTLVKELPAFALELYNRSDTTLLMRARAAYALDRFDEAEKLSLESAAQDRQGYESAQRVEEGRRKRAIAGYELAGYSARQRVQRADALKHLREAEQLTDRDRSPQDWAEVQYAIADLLIAQGRCNSAEDILRSVIEVRTQVLGTEHPDTLGSRGTLAIALAAQGKYTEAEAQFRGVFAIREKVSRSEHHTLESRNSLAIALARQGKPAEAEAQFREIIKVEERVLGPEHPTVLDSCYEFAFALKRQNKRQEAQEFALRATEGARKVLGPDHHFTRKYEKFLADLETVK